MMDAVPESKLSSVFDSEFLEKYHAFNAAAEQQSFQNFPYSPQNISYLLEHKTLCPTGEE